MEQAKTHCTSVDPNDEDIWDSRWALANACEWMDKCLDCTYNDDCYASMSNFKKEVPKDVLAKLNKTSIGDEVCIQEMKSLFVDFPVSTHQILVSDSGALGYRMRTPIVSEDVIRDIQSAIVPHAELSDKDVISSGFIGFELGPALLSFYQRLSRKFYTAFECSQLQALSGGSAVLSIEILREISREKELFLIMKDMGTFSYAVKDASFDRHDFKAHFWGTLQNSAFAINALSKGIRDYNDDVEAEDGKVTEHLDGNSLFFATSPYDPEKTPYTMVKDEETLAEFWILKEFLEKMHVDSDWAKSDYRFAVTLRNGALDISLLPRVE